MDSTKLLNLSGASLPDSIVLSNIYLDVVAVKWDQLADKLIPSTSNPTFDDYASIYIPFKNSLKNSGWHEEEDACYLELQSKRLESYRRIFFANPSIEAVWDYCFTWLLGTATGFGIKPNKVLLSMLKIILLFSFLFLIYRPMPFEEKKVFPGLVNKFRMSRIHIYWFYSFLFSFSAFLINVVPQWHFEKSNRKGLQILVTIEGAFGILALSMFIVSLSKYFIR